MSGGTPSHSIGIPSYRRNSAVGMAALRPLGISMIPGSSGVNPPPPPAVVSPMAVTEGICFMTSVKLSPALNVVPLIRTTVGLVYRNSPVGTTRGLARGAPRRNVGIPAKVIVVNLPAIAVRTSNAPPSLVRTSMIRPSVFCTDARAVENPLPTLLLKADK